MTMKVNPYLIVTRYLSSRTSDRQPYVTLSCERGGANKPRTNPRVDDEQEEVPIKGRILTGLKSMAAKLTEEQLIQTKQFKKSHVPPRNILLFFREQNVCCAVSAQKIYNVVAKIKKNRMQGRNVKRYITPLLEVVGMTPTGKNFIVATAFIRNEQATTYRWVLQQIKHLYFSNEMSIENQQDLNAHEPKLNPLAHKFETVWTSRVMHFGVDTTNRAESEHSLLKLWLLTCHGDLDIVFLNVDSLIRSQIADIKSSLKNSKTKENFNAKSNPILRNISNKISYLALKKISVEITRVAKIIDDPQNNCGHYMRTSHGLPYSCELITQFENMLPIQLVNIEAFYMTLEIGSFHPSSKGKEMDMDSKMHSLTDLLHQISTGPISKVREMYHFVKRVLSPVLPKDPGVTLTSTPEATVTKGQKRTN
ncbi:hypothetical protein M9H77_23826 [Catharanthus roseus]|uniref:Uncharacterized protein n=1 Tax=Catharanthus roseus TaxID=4058 RepID=A0ACC0AX62_CATRO|nr:hypothetical protein M9H77_23826 [Catharanthus roseus]